ncbi:hypothetical protein XF14_13110 [Burkholderia gladioli]|nr:hypothetical protein XF14_13110 [Burkholderia gladioli]
MRGADSYNESLFSTVRLEEFVPQTHPLRPIRTWVNEALSKMDAKFSAMYEADMRTDQVRYTLEYHFPHLCAADRCNGMAIRLLLKLRLPVWPSIRLVLTCLLSSDRFNLGKRPRLLQLNNTAA